MCKFRFPEGLHTCSLKEPQKMSTVVTGHDPFARVLGYLRCLQRPRTWRHRRIATMPQLATVNLNHCPEVAQILCCFTISLINPKEGKKKNNREVGTLTLGRW